MIYLGLLFLEIVVLYILSRKVSRLLSKFLPIQVLSFLFLPGVIIHEIAHLLLAVVLFVPVGEMEFTPKISRGGLKLGSLEIGKTDPIRRSIIGFAPVFLGLMIVIGIVYLFTSNISFFRDKDVYVFISAALTVLYLLFAISNTMFSSTKDMEGTIEILITLIIMFGIAYFFGFRPQLSLAENIFTKEVIDVIQKSSIFLLAPIVIDLGILGIIRVIPKRYEK